MTVRRLLVSCSLLLLTLSGCSGESGTAPPDPAPGQVQAARDALGGPAVALADALLAAAAVVDRARHDTQRGAETSAAAGMAVGPLDALREAAIAADAAARPLAGEDRIGRAADVVIEAAEVGVRAADEGAAQAAALVRLSAFDQRMSDAVATWDAPGSQSDRRTALGSLAAELDALAAEAAAEPAVPEACPALRDARARWAQRLAAGTRELAASATSAGGTEYDQLIATYAADPFGEDRLAADAADRDCWGRESVLARAAAGIRTQVETLESFLQP
jgi:hypothetical protein